MFSKQDIISSLARENIIIKHLYEKATPEMMDYRPSEKQRSIRELLIYMTTMSSNLVDALQAGAYDFEKTKEVSLAQTARGVEAFPTMMDEQFEKVSAFIQNISEEELDREYNLFGMGSQAARQYMLEIMVKNFPAYRMMLFLLLKGAGADHLGTSNVWGGMDMPTKA
ncbi:hypothetical protein KA013_02500 [Patescibacteria group bacterium]|nr:hypothetical protein [Patescibacteria group bacterium]